jgi:hypothetical protein
MMRILRRLGAFALGAVVCAVAHAAIAAGGGMPIQGDWRLDERASKNIPDALKGVDLKITLKGKDLATQRSFEGANVGEPFVVAIDGVEVEKEIGKGQKGKISAQWKANGKLLEQVVKTTAANFLPVTQTTLITVSDDGKVMTRVQTTVSGSDTTERVLIYRRKD